MEKGPALKLQKIDEYRWRVVKEGKMRTDGIVYANEAMMADIRKPKEGTLAIILEKIATTFKRTQF